MGRLVREWESKAIELLDDFEDHVKSDQLSLPIDATVHQLNADTVHFVESVEPFHDSIGQMISRRDERATASATESYVNYKQDLLGALAMNLRNKASDYKSQSTRCLFLMVRLRWWCCTLDTLYQSLILEQFPLCQGATGSALHVARGKSAGGSTPATGK